MDSCPSYLVFLYSHGSYAANPNACSCGDTSVMILLPFIVIPSITTILSWMTSMGLFLLRLLILSMASHSSCNLIAHIYVHHPGSQAVFVSCFPEYLFIFLLHFWSSLVFFHLHSNYSCVWCRFLILLVESWRTVVFSGTVHWLFLKTSFHPLLWTSSGLTGSWKLSIYIGYGSLKVLKIIVKET